MTTTQTGLSLAYSPVKASICHEPILCKHWLGSQFRYVDFLDFNGYWYLPPSSSLFLSPPLFHDQSYDAVDKEDHPRKN
jgi:hypothetical protein